MSTPYTVENGENFTEEEVIPVPSPKLLLVDGYRTHLRRILEESQDDLIRTDYLINELLYSEQYNYKRVTGFTTADVARHLRILKEPTKLDKEEVLYLTDFEGPESNDALDFLAPPIIPMGDLILGFGKAKSKKSLLLVYEIMHALTVSGRFLGFPCRKGKILVFQTEESRASIRKRLRTRGMLRPEADYAKQNQLIEIHRAFDISKDMRRLEEMVEEKKPIAIVFDSLRGISSGSDVSENDPKFARPVYELQRVCIRNNVTGIVIHHQNKSEKQSGVDTMAGTAALQGACFAMWHIKPATAAEEERNIELSIRPRDGEHSTLLIQFTSSENRRWAFSFLGEVGIAPQIIKDEKQILRILAQLGPDDSLSMSQINLEMGLMATEKDRLMKPLNRLLDRQVISSIEDAKANVYYHLPSQSIWTEQILEGEVTEVNGEPGSEMEPLQLEALRNAEKLNNLASKRDILELTNSWNLEVKNAVWGLLSIEEQTKIKKILASDQKDPLFAVGDFVISGENPTKLEVEQMFYNEDIWYYQLSNIKGLIPEGQLTHYDDSREEDLGTNFEADF